FGGPVATGGFLLTLSGNFNNTISGAISGTGGLSMTGAGTLTLNGTNTFTGSTTVSAGTVVVGKTAAFGTGPLILSGGTVAADATARTIGNAVTMSTSSTFGGTQNLQLNGLVTVTVRNGTLTNNNSAQTIFAGGLQLTGSNASTLTVTGTGN